MRKFQAEIDAITAAKLALENAVMEKYPPGSPICWERGGHRMTGTVRMTGYHGAVFVQNDKSGKIYWIDAWNVMAD